MSATDLVQEIMRAADSATATHKAATGALAYLRVSTDMQQDKGLSISAQRAAIRAYAEERDIRILEWFEDSASAFQDESKRVGFLRMLERAKSDREAGMILVHEYSRFSRDPWRTPQIIGDLQRAGVQVVSVTELVYDVNTVMGMWMQKITEAKNAGFSMEVAAHTTKGMRENAHTRDPESGWCFKNGGKPPWGYKTRRIERLDVRGRPRFKAVWEVDTTEVSGKPVWQWVREVLLQAAGGGSLDNLRDMLNEAGVPARRGGAWSTSTLHSLLEPHMVLQYAGYGTWAVRKKRRQRWNRPEEWEIVEKAHPAIISLEIATAVKQARENARSVHVNPSTRMARVRTDGSRFLLSGGLFTCARCGARMAGETNNGKDYYGCGTVLYRRGQGCGPGVHVPKDLIEAETWQVVHSWLCAAVARGGRAVLRQTNADLRQAWIEGRGGEAARSAQRLEQIERAIESLRGALEKGLDDVDWANRRLRELRNERDDLLRAAPQCAPQEPPQVDAEIVKRYAEEMPALIERAADKEKRELLRGFLTSVVLEPESRHIQVGLRLPLLSSTCGGGDRNRTGV